MKKIYSLNLIAYIMLTTEIEPTYEKDKDGLIYAKFPHCQGVSFAIRQFRDSKCSVNLHSFLNCYKAIRKGIREVE